MNNISNDYIAIDTNIFVHLMESSKANNIEKLLLMLQMKNVRLIQDSKNRIKGEYAHKILHHFQMLDYPDYQDIIDYWLDQDADDLVVTVNQNDLLYKKIKEILKLEKKTVDRIFVYVALKANRTLITNDRSGIIDENTKAKDGLRRNKLLKVAHKEKAKSANIYDSDEAYEIMSKPEN